MGRRGRARQQPDENCRLANETIVSQTSQTKSRVTLSFRSHPLKPACLSQAQSSTRSPESATTMVCACPSQTNPGLGKSLKSLLPTQIFLQNRGFAPETRLVRLEGKVRLFDAGERELPHGVALPEEVMGVAFVGTA